MRDERHRLRQHHPHHHAADQPGPAGDGDTVEGVEADARRGHRLAHETVEMGEVGARGDLRHDAAEGPMLRDLGQHQARADARVLVAHHRRRGLVAARLDTQDLHGAGP